MSEQELLDLKIKADNLQEEILDKQFKAQLRELDHRKKMGQFDENEVDFLKEKVGILQSELDSAEELALTQEEIWTIEEQIYDLNKQVLDLESEKTDEINAQTTALEGQAEAQDKILIGLSKQRASLVAIARTSGTIQNPAVAMQLDKIEQQIINRLRETGASPETIQNALNAFREQRSFEEGGEIPSTGWVYGHKKEEVVTAPVATQIRSEAPGLFESMRESGTAAPLFNAMMNSRDSGAAAIQSFQFDQNFSINVQSSQPSGVVRELQGWLRQEFPNMLQETMRKQNVAYQSGGR